MIPGAVRNVRTPDSTEGLFGRVRFEVQEKCAKHDKQDVEYWMTRSSSDFRRQKNIVKVVKSKPALLSGSRSLPEFPSTTDSVAHAVAIDDSGAHHVRDQDDISSLQSVVDSARRKHSLLEARRVKLTEQLALLAKDLEKAETESAAIELDAEVGEDIVQRLKVEIESLTTATVEIQAYVSTQSFLEQRAAELRRLAGGVQVAGLSYGPQTPLIGAQDLVDGRVAP